jgi:hypothetical protein
MLTKTLAATLMLAVSAVAAEPQLPSLRIEPTGGGSILYVKNVADKPLTAFLIELVDYPGSSYSYWEDSVPGGEPVLSGQEKKITIQNMTVGAVPDYVKIRAAIYSDGTTAGIPQRVQVLLDRRRAAREAIGELLNRLHAAKSANAVRVNFATSLNRSAEIMTPPPNSDKMSTFAISRSITKNYFLEIAAYLDAHTFDQAITLLESKQKELAASKPAL